MIVVSAITLQCGVTLPAYATGDYGPDTCLQGWVWREATPSDHVCVTPDIRTQTANDNSQASARRSPNGGPYGPDTCLQGWVWREAVQGDHVCVTPATRSQAANDNSQASARRNSLNIWHTTYTPPNSCNGNVCQTTNSSPLYILQGDHMNIGTLTVELRKTQGDALIATWTVNSTPLSSAPGGQFTLKTNRTACNGSSDSYFRVFDPVSTRWSVPDPVSTSCYTL
jgi:hypothetical protein